MMSQTNLSFGHSKAGGDKAHGLHPHTAHAHAHGVLGQQQRTPNSPMSARLPTSAAQLLPASSMGYGMSSGGPAPRSPRTPRTRANIRTTPRRSPRLGHGHTPARTGLTPRGMTDEDPLGLPFDDNFFMFEDFMPHDPHMLEGLMTIPGEHMPNTKAEQAPFSPIMHKGFDDHFFTGAGLSPLLSGKPLSPEIEMVARRRTGFTPKGKAVSPRLGPYPSPSPYRLQQSPSPGTGFTPRNPDGEGSAGADSSARQYSEMFFRPNNNVRRPILPQMSPSTLKATSASTSKSPASEENESPSAAAKSPKRSTKRSKEANNNNSNSLNLGGSNSNSSSASSSSSSGSGSLTAAQAAAQSSAERAKAAAATAKRGEYRCGKCGFFPKKAKHNCAAEKTKRERGEPVPPKALGTHTLGSGQMAASMGSLGAIGGSISMSTGGYSTSTGRPGITKPTGLTSICLPGSEHRRANLTTHTLHHSNLQPHVLTTIKVETRHTTA